MKKTDVLILGGLSGIAAGISSRQHYPDKKVTLVRKEGTVLIPCGIPYIYGTVNGPQNNVIPDGLLEKNEIELVKSEAVSLDRENKVVTLSSGDSINYEKLIFATGSSPVMPPIPGINKKNIYPVKKEYNYLDRLLEDMKSVKDLVVIGGGFIGVEFADECRKGRDINVTIVEALPHCLQTAFDDEFCIEAENKLTEVGIKIITNTRVKEILGNEAVTGVRLDNGVEIKADMVILGLGAVPNTKLANQAGLRLGRYNAIKVNHHMQSHTDPDIFACGDCAEKQSFFTGRTINVMLASIATSEARIAGANLYSPVQQNSGVISAFSTMINGRAFGVTGLTERVAKEAGINYVIGTAEASDTHPGGMPNSSLTKAKLVFAKDTGILLGGAVSGGRTVGEMINLLSAAIMHRMTENDIYQFQLATHPALTSSPIAYPIINAAGKVISPIKR
jgi:NADPH-dependent 2,4-dienoyl-CoA reductase/sulfur reductase-like enzyme